LWPQQWHNLEWRGLAGNKTLANPGGYMAKHAEKMNLISLLQPSSLSMLFTPPPPGQILDPSL